MENQDKQTMENKAPEKKSKKRLVIISSILGVVLIIGIIYFVISAGYESTDNAQLDADIVPIKASVSGYIKTIHFKDNEHVKKGQLLITIDDVDLKAHLAQAEAALENAKANLLSVKSNANASTENANASSLNSFSVQQSIVSAKARLTKAEADFKRTENMFNAKAATQSQYDGAKADLDVATAQYDAAQNQFKSAAAQSQGIRSQAEAQQSQITLAEAMVKQREAELALAAKQLDYATIESPCDGIVTRRAVEEGQFITIAQPLCSTIDNTHLWITANFKETQVEDIKPGQTVDIKIDAFPNLKIKGVVQSYIGATGAKFSLLPPDNSTGNFVKIIQRVPVRIDITELPKENIDMLYPGLSAFVEVKVK
ncbi:MAG: secretion protein HlyD family protein [Bacteroidetes bacterium]|nr:secretion protein HlyD family protein [Bacteroidota bacterium]